MKSRWLMLVGALAAVAVAGMLSPARDSQPQPTRSATFDCQPRPLARIPAGTRIASAPPKDWTHLISKTQPKLTGEVEKLHERAAELARLLFTSILARVDAYQTPAGPRYRLGEVAIGVGTRIQDQDTIITGQTQDQLGAKFGFLERCVLSGAERELDRLTVLARSDTSMIVDMPGVLLVDGEHRDIVCRYVFMVNPQDGRLEVVLWRMDPATDGDYQLADQPAVRRFLGRAEEVPLHVDARYTLAGVPTPKAFATSRIPPGSPLSMPPSLRAIVTVRQLSPAMAEQIDAEMRQAVGFR